MRGILTNQFTPAREGKRVDGRFDSCTNGSDDAGVAAACAGLADSSARDHVHAPAETQR